MQAYNYVVIHVGGIRSSQRKPTCPIWHSPYPDTSRSEDRTLVSLVRSVRANRKPLHHQEHHQRLSRRAPTLNNVPLTTWRRALPINSYNSWGLVYFGCTHDWAVSLRSTGKYSFHSLRRINIICKLTLQKPGPVHHAASNNYRYCKHIVALVVTGRIIYY